jgi:hypothetical protein
LRKGLFLRISRPRLRGQRMATSKRRSRRRTKTKRYRAIRSSPFDGLSSSAI